MIRNYNRALAGASALLLSFALNSCGDDPELVRRRDEQKAELSRLDSELKILQERIAEIPQDRGKELAELKQKAEDQKQEIESLEIKIEELEAEKAKIEKEHEAYKRKYIVR